MHVRAGSCKGSHLWRKKYRASALYYPGSVFDHGLIELPQVDCENAKTSDSQELSNLAETALKFEKLSVFAVKEVLDETLPTTKKTHAQLNERGKI